MGKRSVRMVRSQMKWTIVKEFGLSCKQFYEVLDFYHAVEHLSKVTELKKDWSSKKSKKWDTAYIVDEDISANGILYGIPALRPTAEKPNGVRHVFINGRPVVKDGVFVNIANAGQVIRV